MRRVSLTIFLGLLVLCAAQLLYYYPKLPDRVASDNSFSDPDGLQPKRTFVVINLISAGVIALVFLGLGLLMPKIPVSSVNLPNRDYWLAPERKKQTYDFLFSYFLWFASGAILLLLVLTHQTVQDALGSARTPANGNVITGLFLGFVAIWIAGLILKFAIKGKSPDG